MSCQDNKNITKNSGKIVPLNEIPDNWQEKHVIQAYSESCKVFNRTRYHVWPCLQELLNNLPTGSRILELGCGNGRHLSYALSLEKEHVVQGEDITPAMVELCRTNKELNVVEGNVCSLRKDWIGGFNCVLCIAVIHHLESSDSRKQAIRNCLLYCQSGGMAMLTVWATKQGPKSKRTFVDNPTRDYFVPFKNRQGEVLGQRYYHVYEDSELEQLVIEVISELKHELDHEYKIERSWWDESNWMIIIRKGDQS